MKTFCNNLGCKSNQSFFLEKTALDQQILELQDIFLEPGLHHIQVTSFNEGRSIINEYLSALRCYNAPACFSLQQEDFAVPNIVDQMSAATMTTFFDLEFDADFLWVECDPELLSFYPTLFITLERVALQQHISIILLIQ